MDENSNFEEYDYDYDIDNLSEQQLIERCVQLEERSKHLRELTEELNATYDLMEQKCEKLDEAGILREQIAGAYTNRC